MEKRTVVRKSAGEDMDEAYVQRLAEEFKKSKEALALIEKRTNDLKKELSDIVDKHGVVDDSGNRWVRIGDMQLKRERRVSRSFDMASAEQWAKDNELWDRVKVVIEQVDEDAILALAWENEDIADIVSGFYGEKETWAFKA